VSDRKQALQDLLAKVEAGADFAQFGWGDFSAAFPPTQIEDGLWDDSQCEWAVKSHNGSLDAAKALHEAVLPEWHFDVATEANGGGFYAAISPKAWGVSFIACSDRPARAWLCALLKALIAEADT
jgi:hypothetical protein